MPVPKFFKANVFRYLDKNDSEEEILEELTEILKEMKTRNNRPFLMCKYRLGKEQLRIYPEDVHFIAIHHTGCQVFLCKRMKDACQEDILRTTLKINSVEEIFSEACGFVRIHNSYIVNMAYIKEISPTNVRLSDDTILSIARSKMKHFQQAFAKYMASKYEG